MHADPHENELFDARDYAPRTDLVKNGAKPQFSLVILSGWAVAYTVMRNGNRQTTDFLLPGDFCHLNALSKAPLDYSIATLASASVARIHRADLEQLFSRYPTIEIAFRESGFADESRARASLATVACRSAEQRVGYLLCDLWTRAEAVGLIENGYLACPATQADMAEYVGLTAVHFNRMLQRVRADGFVDFHGRSLGLPDFKALARASEYSVRDTGYHPTVPMVDLRPSELRAVISENYRALDAKL